MKNLVAVSVSAVVASASYDLTEAPSLYQAFKSIYGRSYADAAEDVVRFNNFQASLRRVNEGNAERRSRGADETQGITKFSDITPAEFRERHLTLAPRSTEVMEATPGADLSECPACRLFPDHANYSAAAGLDWVSKGAVTKVRSVGRTSSSCEKLTSPAAERKVKDQGMCGSCWSFGTTGDIEGSGFLATGNLTSLSEQQLVSCDRKLRQQGCSGGYQEDAFAYIKANGIATEASYPYTAGRAGETGKCKEGDIKPPLTKIAGFASVSSTKAGESNIAAALARMGPMTLGIDASPMQDYEKGVDDPKCGTYWTDQCGCTKGDLNHAVLFVGFGTGGKLGDTPYWKIKNSW
jgi:cathepsin F